MSSLVGNPVEIWGDSQLLNRMIFAQTITSLEQYLFDRAVKDVLKNHDLLGKLVSQDRFLLSEKFTLRDIFENKDILVDKVKIHLAKILYHNLERVRALYGILYRIDVSSQKDQWKFLLLAISYRHDCVHRNGRNIDGEKIVVFDADFVKELISTTKAFVVRVENDVNLYFFENDSEWGLF